MRDQCWGVERTARVKWVVYIATVEAKDENAALAKAKGLFPTGVEEFSDQPRRTPPQPTNAKTSEHSIVEGSSAFKYKMVQVPPNIAVQEKERKGSEAAAYLEKIVNQYAIQGWEFYRVDSVGVNVLPGCLGGLIGQSAKLETYYVITFRRPPN